jgi:hypothetical protein
MAAWSNDDVHDTNDEYSWVGKSISSLELIIALIPGSLDVSFAQCFYNDKKKFMMFTRRYPL